MSNCHVTSVDVSRDIATFSPIIQRIYGSPPSRLISTSSGLTSDITEILNCRRKSEPYVQFISNVVDRQLSCLGCGGRTAALWTCLLYKLLQDLHELGIERKVAHGVVELGLSYCADTLRSVASEPTDRYSLRDLARGLSHRVSDPELIVKCWEDRINPPFVSTLFEKNSLKPSEIIHGYVIKSSSRLNGSKKCILLNCDIKQSQPHTGYKGLVKEKRVVTSDHVTGTAMPDWSGEFMELVQDCGAEVVLTSGVCDVDLSGSGVEVVSGVSYETLDSLAEKVGLDLLSSWTFVEDGDVVGLEFEEFGESWITIKSDDVWTVLLRSHINGGLKKCYQRFLSRFKNALKCGFVIHGRGKSEEFCKNLLQDFSIPDEDLIKYDIPVTENNKLISTIIISKLAELFGFVNNLAGTNTQYCDDFLEADLSELSVNESELSVNESEQNSASFVFDEWTSKVGAWMFGFETARLLDSVRLAMKPVSEERLEGT